MYYKCSLVFCNKFALEFYSDTGDRYENHKQIKKQNTHNKLVHNCKSDAIKWNLLQIKMNAGATTIIVFMSVCPSVSLCICHIAKDLD